MAYPIKSSWGTFNNPQFNRIQSQIQQQTQALLRQRQNLIKNYSNQLIVQQPSLIPVESQKYLNLNYEKGLQKPNSPRNLVADKVRQLLSLYGKQNTALQNELMRVLNEGNSSLNEVTSNIQSSQKTQYFGGNNPITEGQKENMIFHGSRQQQSNESIEGQIQTQFNIPSKSNIRSAMENNSKLQIGDDLIQMIEEIQRKALNEIEKLRQEKIELMKQLKQEIQSNNQLQKQVNNLSQLKNTPPPIQNQILPKPSVQEIQEEKQSLQSEILKQIRFEMNNLRQQNQNLRNITNRSQQINSQYSANINQVNIMRQRITLLENQLRNKDQLIRGLSNQINRLNLNNGITSNSQLITLLQQGELIRQNTLYLIRLKEAQAHSQSFINIKTSSNEQEKIRELEELLQREEQQKQSFLNDLFLFKQRYQQLEEENRILKSQSKMGRSEIARLSPIIDRSNVGQLYSNNLEEYQRHLYEMKGIYRS